MIISIIIKMIMITIRIALCASFLTGRIKLAVAGEKTQASHIIAKQITHQNGMEKKINSIVNWRPFCGTLPWQSADIESCEDQCILNFEASY